jgi:hypothetical protein
MLNRKILNKIFIRKAFSVRSITSSVKEKLYDYGDQLHPTYLQKPGTGKSKKVAQIPGNGIGQELLESVAEIFRHCDVR